MSMQIIRRLFKKTEIKILDLSESKEVVYVYHEYERIAFPAHSFHAIGEFLGIFKSLGFELDITIVSKNEIIVGIK